MKCPIPIAGLCLLLQLHSSAQTTEAKLIGTRSLLSSADMEELGAFDTLWYWHDGTEAYVDTTVVLSDTVWMSILSVGDSIGICSYVYLMSYDKQAHRALRLMEMYPDCNGDQGMENRYSQHKLVGDGTIDIAELVIGPEFEVNGVVDQAPPVLTTLRRITIAADGSFRDTGYLELEKWIGPMYTAGEVSEWGW